MENLQAVSESAKSSTRKAAGAMTSAQTDFATFLTLLTTQLRNQDPLKPLESTEFVAQLASFSSVEQQVRTNETLDRIETLLGASPVAGLGHWIGMQVKMDPPHAFSGAPLRLEIETAPGADRAALRVTDQAGQLVQSVDIAADQSEVTWAGVKPDGTPFPDGTYAFSVESFTTGQSLGVSPAKIVGRVREALVEGQKVYLTLEDGSRVAADQVTSVSNPAK